MLLPVSIQNHAQWLSSVSSRRQVLRLYSRAVCATTACAALLIMLRFLCFDARVRIEAELAEQLQLCKNIAFQVHVEEAREDAILAAGSLKTTT